MVRMADERGFRVTGERSMSKREQIAKILDPSTPSAKQSLDKADAILALLAPTDEDVARAARAAWEANSQALPCIVETEYYLPWEKCCQIVDWREERLREMRAALAAFMEDK